MSNLDQLIEKAAEGSEEARRRLAELLVKSDTELLDRLRKSKASTPAKCTWVEADREALQELVAIADRNPLEALGLLEAARRRRSGRCYEAQVLGAEAQIWGSTQEFALAERALGKASKVAGKCAAAQLDLKRRLGVLRAKQGRYDESTELISEALAGYRALLDPAGHDLDGNGIAACHYARGEPFFHAGEYERAAADWRKCLGMLSPKVHGELYAYTSVNLAWALYKGGLWIPVKELAAARQHFMGSQKESIPRATLYWLAGQVSFETGGTRRRSRWRRYMLMARDDFIAMKMYYEAGAVVSDLSLTYLKDRVRLQRLLKGSLEKMSSADAIVVEGIRNVRKKSAADSSGRYFSDLEAAICHLRELAADRQHLIPCLLTSPNA